MPYKFTIHYHAYEHDIIVVFSAEEVVGAPTLQHIQSHKLYKKTLAKQQSDLKKLDKKHKKVRGCNLCILI